MKQNYFTLLLAAAGLLAGLQAVKAQKVVLHMAGNQTFECSISQLDSITFVGDDLIIEEEHEWVDLGLPSGTLWATCNVGANSPEEYGDYFAWGETEPKSNYKWSTYKHCKGDYYMLTKYCTTYGYNNFKDGLTELLPEDDAASANWGSNWQTPSLTQCRELINSNYTITEWTTLNGVNGRMITSKSNGNSIFLSASGSHIETNSNSENNFGGYWSRSLYSGHSDEAYGLYFDPSYINAGTSYSDRYIGLTVRPVHVKR